MGKFLGRAVGVLALAALAYIGFNAWIAFLPPKRPVMEWRPPSPACQSLENHDPLHNSMSFRCQMRLYEAERLKSYPGQATRDGDNLTIYYRGKPSAHLITDPTGRSDFDGFDFRKALVLDDPDTQKPEQVAVVAGYHRWRDHGEPEYRFISLPDGRRWEVRDASAAPDGRMIVEGDNKLQEDGHTTLYSWPGRKVLARFDIGCRVISWQDTTHFTATCTRNMADLGYSPDVLFAKYVAVPPAFDARVWRDKNGRWQMQATRWLGDRLAYNRDNDMEWSPTFSLYWLPYYTAKAG